MLHPRPRGLFLWVGALALTTACLSPDHVLGPALSVDTTEGQPSWTKLDRGDVVRVTVWGHAEASTDAPGQPIDEAGRLTLPLVGPVEVAGRTSDEVGRLLADRLARFVREPKVVVQVTEYSARDFYVIGHVAKPGPYVLDRPLTALQGLSFGGQLLPGAARNEIYVLREEQGGIGKHAFSVTRPGPDGLFALRPNDVIFVARSGGGRFSEEVLPYLQGLGWATTTTLGVDALRD